ncbi:MAG TPA: DUF4118 domain-containing protein [Symbiobacteriaceae bacterium]
MLSPKRFAPLSSDYSWQPYLGAILLVGAASALGALVVGHVKPTNLVMLYLLAVVVSGLRWGLGAAVLSSILGVLAFDFFMVPPRFSFSIYDAEYLITFMGLLGVALVVGTLTGRLRNHAEMLHRREKETAALYTFSRGIVATHNVTEIAKSVICHIQRTCGKPVALLIREGGRRDLRTVDFGAELAPAEQKAGWWSLMNGQPCGLGEIAMADIPVNCIPLKTTHEVVGVLVVQHGAGDSPLSSDERRLLEAFAAQAAVVLERANLAETARKAELLLETDRLYDALLHSVSHALRTPLASIIGGLSTVLDPSQEHLDEATRRDLLQTAREEAERLNGLVGNLLDMTRLESGRLKLNIDWYDPADVIGAVLGQTADRLKDRHVTVQMDEDLPMVPLDQVLVVHVLENLLDNADKYSPPGRPIDISLRQVGDAMEVTVADRGTGITEEDAERVFEKFLRLERPGSPAGTGLGLAICKGIVEAHRGHIWARPRAGGGAEISFALPLSARTVEAGDFS